MLEKFSKIYNPGSTEEVPTFLPSKAYYTNAVMLVNFLQAFPPEQLKTAMIVDCS